MLTLVIGLAGLLAGIAGLYLQVQYSAEESAFRTADSCDSPQAAATSQACKYTGPATISGSRRDGRLYVVVVFAAMPGRNFNTSFSTQREPPPAIVKTGITATAQLWNGMVTEFAGVGTADDPAYLPSNFTGAALIFVAAGSGVGIWAVFLVRRAWRT